MHRNIRLFFIIFAMLLPGAVDSAAQTIEINYAEGFSAQRMSDHILVSVCPFTGSCETGPIRYVLIDKERESFTQVRRQLEREYPMVPASRFISVPVERCILLSTTFLHPFKRFDAVHRISGVDFIDYIYDQQIRRQLKENRAVEVGNGPSLDMERLVSSQPDMVMVNLIEGEWNTVPKLEQSGFPVVVNRDYLETSPLGRAEWVKFIALFLGELQRADKWFGEIERRYLALAAKAKEAETVPSVLLNTPLSGRWVVPGGEGYIAQLLKDANSRYLWAESEGSSSLVLDVESVFAKSVQADVWLHQYGMESLKELEGSDGRFSRMKAVKTGRVVNNDARVSGTGSNDFYESGAYNPDIILADLIAVLHPELLPEHELSYYRYLE